MEPQLEYTNPYSVTAAAIPLSTLMQPPIVIENDEEKPLAHIPLSQLMNNADITCPVCGKKIAVDTAEVRIDGQTYYACKTCAKKKR